MKKSHIAIGAIASTLLIVAITIAIAAIVVEEVYEPHNWLTYLGEEFSGEGEWYLISNGDVATIILTREDGAPTVASYSGFTGLCDEHGDTHIVLNGHEWIPIYNRENGIDQIVLELMPEH